MQSTLLRKFMHAFLCPSNFIDLALVIEIAHCNTLGFKSYTVSYGFQFKCILYLLSACHYIDQTWFFWEGDLENHQEIATIAMGNKHFCNTGCYLLQRRMQQPGCLCFLLDHSLLRLAYTHFGYP